MRKIWWTIDRKDGSRFIKIYLDTHVGLFSNFSLRAKKWTFTFTRNIKKKRERKKRKFESKNGKIHIRIVGSQGSCKPSS